MKQAPITIKILLDKYKILDFSNTSNQFYWRLFSICILCLKRKSNLVPNSDSQCTSSKYLKRKNV